MPAEYQCFDAGRDYLKTDPILRLTLDTTPKTDERIVYYAKKIKEFAFYHCKKNMPAYVAESFHQLETTFSHTLQIAAIFFYAAWHCDWDPETDTCAIVEYPCGKDKSINFFHELGFAENIPALREVAKAVWGFERGQGVSTVFGFVHTLVSNWWEANACTPPARSKRQRIYDKLASSSAAAAGSKSLASESSSSSESTQTNSSSESGGDAHQSDSSDDSSDPPPVIH